MRACSSAPASLTPFLALKTTFLSVGFWFELSFLLDVIANLFEHAALLGSLAALSILILVGFAAHNLIKLLVGQLLTALLRNSLLQLLDVFEVLFLFDVFSTHLVVFQGLMKLLVFGLGLILLKGLDLGLLLKQALLYIHHLLVRFQHLGEEVVRSRNRDFGLDQEPHPLHHIVAYVVVEPDLALNFILYRQLLRHNDLSFVSYITKS